MVILEDCRVPAANRLGAEGIGFQIAMEGINGGRLGVSSCSLGGASAALQLAKANLMQRKQFGQRLADFQYLQFTYVDMATKLFTSRLLLREAARALDAAKKGASDAAAGGGGAARTNAVALTSMAKLHVTESCHEVIDWALQAHGGYGYLKDSPVQQLLRDTRVHRILEGTNEVMRRVLCKLLLLSDS